VDEGTKAFKVNFEGLMYASVLLREMRQAKPRFGKSTPASAGGASFRGATGGVGSQDW
jgi:hypothetical protein